MPGQFIINDNMIELPASPEEAKDVEIIYGPNIKPFPTSEKLPETVSAKVALKVGNDITTDHIMPAGAKILPYRSNIPFLSQFCFKQCDENFASRCKELGKGIIIGVIGIHPLVTGKGFNMNRHVSLFFKNFL